ncbi:SRPBCC family protein [Mycolicibacterium cosmeticum]|uniref:SRPBCC family protein n=1 Tax=Mycolicibacterium cosmeticum TaxID=258533 RepID=UPI003204F7AE
MRINVVRLAALAAVLYGARRYWRNWGTTKEECETALSGDERLHAPRVTTTEGVWVDRPVDQVWPSVVRQLRTEGDGKPAVGDVVWLVPPGRFGSRDGIALSVVEMTPDAVIVLQAAPPSAPWEVVWSLHLVPRWDDRCRLLVRTRVGLRHPAEFLVTALTGPLVSALNRRLLLAVKRAAEQRSAQPAAVAAAVP